MSTYGQFCPIAIAAEMFAERWTPLVLRELLHSPKRFALLHRGLPRMSKHLLVNRLSSLEAAGIVQREPAENGRGFLYSLTQAGLELEPVIETLGSWGYKWSTNDLKEENLDPGHILWALRRYTRAENIPEKQVVILFRFPSRSNERFWMVLKKPEPDLCITDPGFDLDMEIETDPVTLSQICLGKLSYATAIKNGQITQTCLPRLKGKFTTWFGVTPFSQKP